MTVLYLLLGFLNGMRDLGMTMKISEVEECMEDQRAF
jgi:hypothetical protein